MRSAPRGVIGRLLELTVDLACIVDFDGRFLELSDGWTDLLGHACDGLIGQRLLDFVQPDDVDSVRDQLEEMRRGGDVVRLAGGQHEPHGQAVLVDNGVDLRAQSATRTADGVSFAPFFPPAACWWARMIELSISAMDVGDFAAKASKTLIHTPALAQRLKRL